MIKQFKQRLNNMRVVSQLISTSEIYANEMGEEKAGAEHLVLAAFDLPDGSARALFKQVGGDPDAFRAAIEKQYQDALNSVGIHTHGDDYADKVEKKIFPGAQPSFRTVMRDMMQYTRFWDAKPLEGATVLAAVTHQKSGVALRALRVLEIDLQSLRKVAEKHLA